MHKKLQNKYYFINKFDTNYIDKQDTNTAFIYRNYQSKIDLISIIKIKNYCKKKGYKFFLSNNIKLAISLNLDGAYIPSSNKNTRHLAYSFKKNFLIIGSAHNNREVKTKELQGAKMIFISSIFKKNKNYLGTYRFKLLSKQTSKKIIALGGINKNNINNIKLLNCYGIASISYIKDKLNESN